MIKYRIEWVSLLTGFTGNGEWFELKDKRILIDIIENANIDLKNEIKHWLAHSNKDER